MNEIIRNTDVMKGAPDGVFANIQCNVTLFEVSSKKKIKGKPVEMKVKEQGNIPCKVSAAYSAGTVSFSLPQLDLMLVVRLDELMAIIQEAAKANQDLQDSLPQEYTDIELEARWKVFVKILLDEAESPSGLVLSEKWWRFAKGTDRDDIMQYFNEHHSKGVDYLCELIK